MTCKARQYSDQMQCARCGLAWDMNDPEPPDCLTPNELGMKKLKAVVGSTTIAALRFNVGIDPAGKDEESIVVIAWDHKGNSYLLKEDGTYEKT